MLYYKGTIKSTLSLSLSPNLSLPLPVPPSPSVINLVAWIISEMKTKHPSLQSSGSCWHNIDSWVMAAMTDAASGARVLLFRSYGHILGWGTRETHGDREAVGVSEVTLGLKIRQHCRVTGHRVDLRGDRWQPSWWAACGSRGRAGWLVTGRLLVRSPAPPPPNCSWWAGCCRPVWWTALLVCECVY